MSVGQFAVSEIESRISRSRFLEKLSRLGQIVRATRFEGDTGQESLAAEVEIVGNDVVGRPLFDRGLFFRGKLGLELGDNILRDLSLDLEDIGHVAIVTVGP